jgi:arylformamidase
MEPMAQSKAKKKQLLTSTGWIDASVPISDGMVHWPGDPAVKIKHLSDMDQGDDYTVSHISMMVHTGTHMDAPLHFTKSKTGMDKMPLDATVGKARVIEIHSKDYITPEELRPQRIRKGERILFKTRNSKSKWDRKPFNKKFIPLSIDAARFLAERKIKTLGVDYLSIGEYDGNVVEVHRTILKAGIWVIEGLDLSKIEPGDYEMICLPLKIVKSDGAPARAILRKL